MVQEVFWGFKSFRPAERNQIQTFDKKAAWTHGSSSSSHWDQRVAFSTRPGLTRADFHEDGNTHEVKELLDAAITQGSKASRHPSSRWVETASSSHVLDGDRAKYCASNKSSVTRYNKQSKN